MPCKNDSTWRNSSHVESQTLNLGRKTAAISSIQEMKLYSWKLREESRLPKQKALSSNNGEELRLPCKKLG